MSDQPRQRVVRVPGARRARLTPAPDTDTAPETPVKSEKPAPTGPAGPNDEQMLRDVPPHY